MNHSVTLDELNAWMSTQTASFAVDAGSGKYKNLNIKLSGGFRVMLNGETIYEGTNAVEAIETYNSL